MLDNRFRARFASLTASSGTGGAPPWWVQCDPPEPSRRRVKKVNLALYVALTTKLLPFSLHVRLSGCHGCRPSLNFSLNKERALFEAPGPLCVPETVHSERIRKACADERSRANAHG